MPRFGSFLWLVSCALALAAFASENTLVILRPMLHESDDGPPIPADYRYHPGELVFFSFQVSGYKRSGGADEAKSIDVAYEIDVRDGSGVLIDRPNVGSVGTKVSQEDRDWLPKVRYEFGIPPLAESGDYKISVKLWDRVGKTETAAEIPLRVEGRAVAPSDTLVVRNFRFLRSEDDKNPLAIAAYRPGDTLWAKFDITGYKFGPENRLDVEYGVAVAGPDGAVGYSQPHAAEVDTKSFYPQRYQPGVVSLSVPPDMTKARYTLIVTVKDDLGKQTAEVKEPFTVE